MPSAGSAARPWLNMRKTNSSMRLDVASSVSRKMPPKNGRKKTSIIRALKPKLRRASSGGGLRPHPDLVERAREHVPPQAGDQELVAEGADGGRQRRRRGPGLPEGIGDAVKLAAGPHQGSGREGAQLEGLVVEEPPRLRIGGEENLKSAVEEEAVHAVRADAAHPARRTPPGPGRGCPSPGAAARSRGRPCRLRRSPPSRPADLFPWIGIIMLFRVAPCRGSR